MSPYVKEYIFKRNLAHYMMFEIKFCLQKTIGIYVRALLRMIQEFARAICVVLLCKVSVGWSEPVNMCFGHVRYGAFYI